MSGKYIEMDVRKMKEFPNFTPQEMLSTHYYARDLVKKTEDLAARTKDAYMSILIKEIVEKYYDIGAVSQVYQIFGGYINETFGIYTEKDGEKYTWIFRVYKRGKKLKVLLFEHAMCLHLKANGFDLGSVPVSTKNGSTYQIESLPVPEGGEEDFYFAVFTYLPGKNTYVWGDCWDKPCHKTAYRDAAVTLAKMHNAGRNFNPQGLHGENQMLSDGSTISDTMHKLKDLFRGYRDRCAEGGYVNAYSRYLDTNYEYLMSIIDKSIIPEHMLDDSQFPVTTIECDYHPGNLKYDDNDNVTGSFDYDYANMDIRIFDVGCAVHYCFPTWAPERDGAMNLEIVADFLKTYNDTLKDLGGLSPFTESEKKYFYEAVLQGNLYIVGWCLRACAEDMTLDPFEYLYYLQHLISCLKWLEDNEQDIRKLIKGI
ncbi:MAG: phosphotransferase [Acetivibrionales bacterium]|jgi:homoserine kinase type II